MIRVPGNFIWLACPRTASRTFSETLLERCGGERLLGRHHARKKDLYLLNGHSEPVIGIVRDPYDYVLSSYARWTKPEATRLSSERKIGFEQFLNSNWQPDLIGEWDGAITPYQGYVDYYFLYEDGLEAIFSYLGFPGITLKQVGIDETPEYAPIDEMGFEVKRLIEERFWKDIKFYRYWQERNQSMGNFFLRGLKHGDLQQVSTVH